MTSQDSPASHAPPFPPSRTGAPLGVAMIGFAFMGKAHSNAWRNVASYFDVPPDQDALFEGRGGRQVRLGGVLHGLALGNCP